MFQLFLLSLMVFVPSTLATPALVKNEECPLITLKDELECQGRSSECWTPGQGDVDCPNNGLCCFDGCANKCKIPEEGVEVFVPPPLCTVEYEQREEDIELEHCVDVPDLQMCTKTEKAKCQSECEIIYEAKIVEEERKCCKAHLELVCKEVTCDENDFHMANLTFDETVCKKQRPFCFKRPEQVCSQNTDNTDKECKIIEKGECIKASETCTTERFPEKQIVKNNCEVKDQKCEYKKVTKCDVVMEPVSKPTPKKVCKDVCKQVVTNECTPKTTRKDCKKIMKTMFYKVPIESC